MLTDPNPSKCMQVANKQNWNWAGFSSCKNYRRCQCGFQHWEMRKSKSVVTLRSATASLNPGTLWKTRTCLSPEVINHLFSASKTLSKINDSYYINDGSPRLNKDTVYEHFDIAFRTYMLRQVRRIGSLLDLNWNRLDCFTQLGWAYEVIFIHQS